MTGSRTTPFAKPLIYKDNEEVKRKQTWNYRSLVGMLSYLQGSVRPDIFMAVHQCDRFCNDSKVSHERALNRIVKYLIGSSGKGLIYKTDKDKGIEWYRDADFVGCWDSENLAKTS